jgi:hypothetical protein
MFDAGDGANDAAVAQINANAANATLVNANTPVPVRSP